MIRDRERLRAALVAPRTEAARDAALALGAAGTLDDVSLAFGRARFGGCEDRFLAPALSAISSVTDPRIVALLEACLVDAPASSGRDQLCAALQRGRGR